MLGVATTALLARARADRHCCKYCCRKHHHHYRQRQLQWWRWHQCGNSVRKSAGCLRSVGGGGGGGVDTNSNLCTTASK